MFVWSFRMSKRELIIIGVGVAAFVITVLLLLFAPSGAAQSSAMVGGYTLSAGDESERERFVTQFGWTMEKDPVTVRELIIPKRFDDAYEEYNELQKRQGFDLSALRGKRVKLWCYQLTNHPAGDRAVINILVADGVVVGGDISSNRADGFMHGFDPVVFSQEIASTGPDGDLDRNVPDSIPTDEDAPPEPVEDSDEE